MNTYTYHTQIHTHKSIQPHSIVIVIVIYFHIPLIQRYANSHNYTYSTTHINIYPYI